MPDTLDEIAEEMVEKMSPDELKKTAIIGIKFSIQLTAEAILKIKKALEKWGEENGK